MYSKNDATGSAPDSKGANEHTDHAGEPVIESVARGIGTAIGVVASTAAKVMGKSESAEPETKAPETKSREIKAPETKSQETKKEKPRKTSKPRAAANENATKLSASRIAKKKKKRAAHRIKLRRSNTKG